MLFVVKCAFHHTVCVVGKLIRYTICMRMHVVLFRYFKTQCPLLVHFIYWFSITNGYLYAYDKKII